MLIWTALVLVLCVPSGQAYNMYREEIPNGDHVPHPCKPNFLWHGVGHINPSGGGDRNPFGQDFAANGRKWNEALCQKDSDGDGKTNGQELGDPDCVWTKGQTPPRTSDISHPGVCEPMTNGECVRRNSWVDCSLDEEFDCDAIKDPDVRNLTLRFPRTKVPAKETTYICFNFELPDDREYHLIATKPFIDNYNVMHHIVVSGCDNSVGLLKEPAECLMGAQGCAETLALWTVGVAGTCITPQAGYLIGKGHTHVISMQMHWTNPTEVDTWYDSSGMVLYYTPKLRPYNAGILTIGQTYLSIPPGQSSWVHEGTCRGRCTKKKLKGDVHVFSTINHMHYLGIRQNVTLTRSGGQFEVVAEDNPYRYDSPETHFHDPPITIRPGDELKTYCTFQSRSRSKTTLYGEGSFEEMCFAFLSFYPLENLGAGASCIQFKDTDYCDLDEWCNFEIFNYSVPSTASSIRKVMENCDHTGSTCRQECPAAVKEVVEENSCLHNTWDYFVDTVYRYTKDPYLMMFLTAMRSCPGFHDGDGATMGPTARPLTTHKPATFFPDTGLHNDPGSWLVNLVKHLDARPLLQNIIMNINNNNYRAGDSSHDDDHDDTWH